ncbi:GNAT family N-acetyltransferase [Trinickia caryophylli]|uniref:Acetyltransferase (GNAT) domain-containing protein n=1 Tax=Trinickia caryophylli TaxID=28094 RepID=A0A1X7D725_TRICW|nr:GNAT family N-acetyltransferase [Trinickia caryophylli]PMS12651.1 N-acetyltransferase [Trinickia caryophylli]TRX15057.1 GNAT family N-acetyltransferase [Trinickia caryophylli]WQE14916.1 GNAT family N-acetyltransferase [Trinickia caryophylli]SMF10172.1 Acetyltransferase (GNAT) domain-containing protein [Trinickia caryophylli]GLU31357.1 N-acetyltransferase [Trinickia caryophylli]
METEALRISEDKSELDIELIHTFLRDHAPWARGIPREIVERAIEGSLCFGAYLGKRQVGFARLVTDLATVGYLCDVFVLPEFRSRGYAGALMHHIFDSERLKVLRRIVLVTTDAHGVYRPHGFHELEHPERYMELHRPDVYAAP